MTELSQVAVSSTLAFDVERVRHDFPALQQAVHGKPLVYLDSAATSLKPQSVIDAVVDVYARDCANIHRAVHLLSQRATARYEEAREKVRAFLNAARSREVVFTRGTTESINLVAQSWGRSALLEGDEVLVTELEHHSNIVPWQLIAELTGAELAYLELNDDYTVDTSMLEKVIDERTRIVGISGMSNVTGAIGPVAEVTAAARAVGAIVVMDGAQSVPHTTTAVAELDVDFLAFSAHKMLGPTGIGALWGRPELLEEMSPVEGGGQTLRKRVTATAEQMAPVTTPITPTRMIADHTSPESTAKPGKNGSMRSVMKNRLMLRVPNRRNLNGL